MSRAERYCSRSERDFLYSRVLLRPLKPWRRWISAFVRGPATTFLPAVLVPFEKRTARCRDSCLPAGMAFQLCHPSLTSQPLAAFVSIAKCSE